jgi:hypothetical protein
MGTPTPHENAGSSPLGPVRSTSRGKVVIGCLGVSMGLLVAAIFVVPFFHSTPPAVARQYLADQGVGGDNPELIGHRDQGAIPLFPFGGVATVEFRVKGADPRSKLVVTLTRDAWFLPWHAVALEKKVEK